MPGEVLVNHHATSYGETSGSPSTSFLAPLKKAVLEDGTLYLKWWPGNDLLRQRPLAWDGGNGGALPFDPARGLLLEGALRLPGWLRIDAGAHPAVEIRVDRQGVVETGLSEGETFVAEERADRQMALASPAHFRLLLREKILEFYLEDVYIQSYSMVKPPSGRIEGDFTNANAWAWETS